MAGRHHRLDGRELEWTPGVGDAQGGLACFGPAGSQSDTTEHLNRLRKTSWPALIAPWCQHSLTAGRE